MRLISLIITTLLANACQGIQQSDNAQKSFYENSRRTPANASESEGIVRLKVSNGGYCAGFVMYHTLRRNLVMTALHCLDDDAANWCRSIGEIEHAPNGKSFRCRSILVEDKDTDMVLLDVGENISSYGYRLSNQSPSQRLRLIMLGYPNDLAASVEREGSLPTKSENCWVTGEKTTPQFFKSGKSPNTLQHNCSTFGGNSGGPIFAEGTNIVVGMPSSYDQNIEKQKPWTNENTEGYKSAMVLAYEFVQRHAAILQSFGLESAVLPQYQERRAEYLTVSRCTTTQSSEHWMEWIVPNYNTSARIQSIDVMWNGSTSVNRYVCSDTNVCTDQAYKDFKIEIIDHVNLKYTGSTGGVWYFTCQAQ